MNDDDVTHWLDVEGRHFMKVYGDTFEILSDEQIAEMTGELSSTEEHFGIRVVSVTPKLTLIDGGKE